MTAAANTDRCPLIKLGLFAALWCAAASAHAASVSIHAEKQGGAVAITARATLEVPLSLIWETLTDYDRLALFVPGIRDSRVIERRGAATIVRQDGEAGFLIFTQPINVVVEALEKPPHVIAVRLVSGNLRKLDGRYQIEPDADKPEHFVLHWSGLIEPESRLPPLIGVAILRRNIGQQFSGLVREIERRAAALKK